MLKIEEIIGYIPYELRAVCKEDVYIVDAYVLSANEFVLHKKDRDLPQIARIGDFKPLLLPVEEVVTKSGALKKTINDDVLLKIASSLGYSKTSIAWKYLIGNTAAWVERHTKAADVLHSYMIDYRELIKRGDAVDAREYV